MRWEEQTKGQKQRKIGAREVQKSRSDMTNGKIIVFSVL